MSSHRYLLELPLEMRLEIYEVLEPEDTRYIQGKWFYFPPAVENDCPSGPFDAALIGTCMQIREEATAHFFRRVTLYFNDMRRMWQWLSMCSTYIIQGIQRVSLVYKEDSFQCFQAMNMLTRCTGLRELTIFIASRNDGDPISLFTASMEKLMSIRGLEKAIVSADPKDMDEDDRLELEQRLMSSASDA